MRRLFYFYGHAAGLAVFQNSGFMVSAADQTHCSSIVMIYYVFMVVANLVIKTKNSVCSTYYIDNTYLDYLISSLLSSLLDKVLDALKYISLHKSGLRRGTDSNFTALMIHWYDVVDRERMAVRGGFVLHNFQNGCRTMTSPLLMLSMHLKGWAI